jgi:hypothetical protein
MRFSSIILILPLASSQTSGQNGSGPRRRRAEEVDNDVALDDSMTLIEPITNDPTNQPTMATDFNEWLATAQPATADPSGLPTPAPATTGPTTVEPSGLPTTASLVNDESTDAPTEEANTLEPSVNPPTSSPNTIGCIDYVRDFNGGDIEEYCHTLYFEYEVETSPNVSLFALEQSLIPSVENSILDSLTPLVVGECRNEFDEVRMLSDRNIDMLHNAMSTHRRAQILGLGASPTDTRRVGAGSTCQSIRTSPNHRCSVVSAAVTVCSTNFANDKNEVLGAIQEGMEDDTYNEAHAAIVKLFFMGEDAEAKEEEEVVTISDSFDDENDQTNSGSETNAVDKEDSTLTVGRESGNVLVDDADGEDNQLSDGDENGDDYKTGKESKSARDSVTITHPLQGAKLWGVLLGVIAAIFTFVLLGKRLAEDKEYDCAGKAGASETSSSEDGEEQV